MLLRADIKVTLALMATSFPFGISNDEKMKDIIGKVLGTRAVSRTLDPSNSWVGSGVAHILGRDNYLAHI